MVSLRGGDETLTSAFAHLDLVPRKGRLVPLRTKDEVRASLETYQAYVVELPSKYAGVIKDAIQRALPDLKTADFQHLRRVVQFKFLPPHLQQQFKSPRGDTEPALDDAEAEDESAVRYFLVSPTSAIQHADLLATLRKSPPFTNRPPRIFYVTVPALAPTSAEQAEKWTNQFWPIAYKNTNPYGPHPSLVSRNTAEIEADAGHLLALTQSAANQTSEKGLGEQVGCVVVDNSNGRQEIIALAGDCRWRSPLGEAEPKEGQGNVMAHAVQRAIAIVAKKRLRAAGKDELILDRTLFCDTPLTDLEAQVFEVDNIARNGYLCVDLDIYVTHEPCVMCSMAILHSRFKRCIFGTRMPFTGGLTADPVKGRVGENVHVEKGLGHGIFWRPSELNWKLLAWEWKDEDAADEGMITNSISDTLQA
ncbi:cytidine deaminase-like protein [Westerdykella ornata]|uniref:Cytidine deaminase-like protein n=1 Tax=Westerdykella ornata TaxID=318751 RepID=A0A6A6JZJ5_WESOR|nr:cytidine deaminase-like protein [Westerdykella ornata]KAF2280489.1 cytidine deaminase-like protein [Westerdykella ornata]